MEVKDALRRFRQREKLSQGKVAERIGITPQAYQQYEFGSTNPTVKVLISLAKEFNVTTDYLLGLSDTPQPMQFDEQEVREAFELRDSLAKVFFRLKNVEQQN